MCKECSDCFNDEEKAKLKEKGWNDEEISFADDSIIENKIRELIK